MLVNVVGAGDEGRREPGGLIGHATLPLCLL